MAGEVLFRLLEKQSKIDQLLEENERLRQKLRYEERKAKRDFSVPRRHLEDPFKGIRAGAQTKAPSRDTGGGP